MVQSCFAKHLFRLPCYKATYEIHLLPQRLRLIDCAESHIGTIVVLQEKRPAPKTASWEVACILRVLKKGF